MKQVKQKKSQMSRNQKNKKYCCKICDYYTSKKSDLEKHKTTKKHIRNTSSHFLAQHKYVCEYCNERFKSRTTVWRHKKKCIFNTQNQEMMVQNFGQKNAKNGQIILDQNLEKNQTIKENQKSENMMQIFLNKLEKKEKQNEDLWKAFQEQQTLLKNVIDQNSEIIPRIGNNNNNQISINVVLNEKCKNAMNLEDFLQKLQVSLDDLMYTKENGYVKGLSNIMAKHLNDLQPNDRPIHCSDQNKLQFYVKDENIWEKDEKNTKVNKSINEIQRKQVLKIKEWTNTHPNYCEDNELYVEYQKLIQSTMCINNQDNTDIKKNISDIINIDDVVTS
jgi:hypothetical protein